LHLNHRCTYDFVNSRLSHKKNKTKQSFPSHIPHRSITSAAERGSHQFAVPGFSEPNLAADGNTITQYAACLNEDPAEYEDSDASIGLQVRGKGSGSSSLLRTSELAVVPGDLPLRVHGGLEGHKLSWAAAAVPVDNSRAPGLGLWSGSPIHLLNSRVEQKCINESLGDVYNSMMSGIAIRYLESKTNLYADGTSKYTFDVIESAMPEAETGTKDGKSQVLLPSWKCRSTAGDLSRLQPLTPEQLSAQMKNITMLGVARFLDVSAL
jgi:hypothetical protein